MFPTFTIDIGTTSIKLALFSDGGDVLAERRVPTPTLSDAEGTIYDVDALVGAVAAFIRELDPAWRRSIARIALTGVGESGGLLRSDLSLASPIVLWHDQRGAALLRGLGDAARERITRITGLPVNPNYGLSKTAWAAQRAGATIGDAVWLNVAEILAAFMTGRRGSEFSLASRTMALDLRHREWSAEVCGLVGLDTSIFPELHAAADGAAISESFALAHDLDPAVRVHVAGHDHMVGAVGADLRAGEVLNSTGTTEGVLLSREEPALDAATARAKLANGVACTADDYTLFASIPSGGSVFATLQRLLGLDALALTDRIAAVHGRYLQGAIAWERVPVVLPQFRGSAPPTKDAAARGAIAGLASDTTLDDLVLGTFLGMVLQFRDVLALFPAQPSHIKVIGPAARNPLWLQLKADVLGAPLSVARFPEVVSRGAQALASGATPAWQDCDPVDVEVDEHRYVRLSQWQARVAPQWEHLKAVPS